jgi:rsbT co-antagonist protein RsbR
VETATFVFSFKRPLFMRIQQEYKGQAEALGAEMWSVTELLDEMGLYTTEIFQKSREELINRQQEELLELSTPVVKLWDGIVALPLIGTLDSARTQVVMESLLQAIVQTNSRFAIIDITGVPTVDTVVAQHLLKTVTAARLMGADCIISGVRPQIAPGGACAKRERSSRRAERIQTKSRCARRLVGDGAFLGPPPGNQGEPRDGQDPDLRRHCR